MTFNEASKMTEEQARAYLESLRWANGRTCPHCSSAKSFELKGNSTRAGVYKCSACRKPFTVTVGSIFHGSHIGLREWVMAFHLICGAKKGISALQLQRSLGIKQYKSAWHMAHRIRHAMTDGIFDGTPMTGPVEVDETYVGGKVKGKGHKAGWDNKTPVVTLVEREGMKRSMVMHKVTSKNLRAVVEANVTPGTHVHTDDHRGYLGLKKDFQHASVNHSEKEYCRTGSDGLKVTTNTVESSFALLKRGIVGSFHHVSKEHLHRYLTEFDFRWNMRKSTDGERAEQALKQTPGKRLFYKKPKSIAA
jgi:transposase-like protein